MQSAGAAVAGRIRARAADRGSSAQGRGLLRLLLPILPFWLLDLTLRAATDSGAYYALYAAAPNLFSLGFGALFTALALLLPRRRGRVLYGAIYALWAVYAVVQYGVWRIFDRFLFLSDFLFAGEGLDFAGYARQLIDGRFVLVVLLFVLWGALGVRALPADVPRRRACPGLVLCFAVTQLAAPQLYAAVPETLDWDAWESSGYEYERFSSSAYDLALTGPYQFVLRDAWLSVAPDGDAQNQLAAIDEFFSARAAHQDNAMTGLLAGKNLILVQLESIDDFVLNEQNTPTLARLQSEGINFSEFYTSQYSNGYTFNTEFAAQTGVYPYANGNVAYSLSRSAFPDAMGSLFEDAGYTANSFHKSEAKFYNRGAMHQAFGYEQYYSALDHADSEMQANVDEFLVDCDALYDELLRWDESLKQELRGAFGDSFFQDGKLNKKALGKLVFADQKAMARLNGIVFSAVGTAVEEIIEKSTARGVVIDAINLVESGLARRCDFTVALTAPAEVRLRRIMARDGIDEAYAKSRMAAQKSDGFYKKHCTFLLENRASSKGEFRQLIREFFEDLMENMEE